jgi:hypothetical protein
MSRGNVEAECKTLWCPTTPLTPFNTSLNPTAYSATLMREASALQWFAAAG